MYFHCVYTPLSGYGWIGLEEDAPAVYSTPLDSRAFAFIRLGHVKQDTTVTPQYVESERVAPRLSGLQYTHMSRLREGDLCVAFEHGKYSAKAL
jgi:hypothetical protein